MSPASRATPGASRRRLAGLCLLPLLALAACSGSEDDPEPILSSDAASESPPPPSSDPTKQPWEKRTKAGAVAFVKHWVDELNAAGVSGDTQTLASLSRADCASCSQLVSKISSVYEDGGSIEGGAFRVEAIGSNDQPRAPRVQVAVEVVATSQVIRRPGQGPTRVGQQAATLIFSLRWQTIGWRVAALERT